MRAKFVYESLNKFTRGQDPKVAMNIGKKSEIVNWLNDLEIEPRYYEIDDKLNITVKGNLDLSYTNITKHNRTSR